MSRVLINTPDHAAIFKTDIDVTVNFINYGGHMSNDAFLTVCQEARLRYMQQLGGTELAFYGGALIQADAAIVYKSQAFHGDTLSVALFVDDIAKYGFDFIFLISHRDDGREIARAKTGMLFFDYEKQKVCTVTEQFRAAHSTHS